MNTKSSKDKIKKMLNKSVILYISIGINLVFFILFCNRTKIFCTFGLPMETADRTRSLLTGTGPDGKA